MVSAAGFAVSLVVVRGLSYRDRAVGDAVGPRLLAGVA